MTNTITSRLTFIHIQRRKVT